MAGLSRFKNLSEKNLNLKTALQKLYAPGIENDIELFSLSSRIESVIISGPEIIESDDILSQIYALETQKISVRGLQGNVVLSRTRFKTRYLTYTNGNKLYFTKLNVSPGSLASSYPIFSNNGSVPGVRIIYGGRGFYFVDINTSLELDETRLTVVGVKVVGETSASDSALVDIEFEKEPGTSPARYSMVRVIVQESGEDYLIPEDLKIVEDEEHLVVVGGEPQGQAVLKKQRGTEYPFTEALLSTDLRYYRVVDADSTGFCLYDDEQGQYVFIDRDVEVPLNSSVEIRRKDSIRISNLLQFKFAGSTIRLNYYSDNYSLGDSVSGELSRIGTTVSGLIESNQTAIQNTKKPTNANSEENVLGFRYNEFVGRDILIWQRVVIRDQDYLIDPSVGITGDLLKTEVSNFTLDIGDTSRSVPGLFIKVGNEYFRAFSTTDKPFFLESGLQIINPDTRSNTGANFGRLSAESAAGGSTYSYDTEISEFAQRINSNGKDGAFYFHIPTKPTVRSITVRKNNANSTIFAIPLFTSAS